MTSSPSSERPPVFKRVLWQLTQYLLRTARSVDTVVRPRNVDTSVRSPISTSTFTRDSRPTEAVAASVAIVDVDCAVYTLIAPETILT